MAKRRAVAFSANDINVIDTKNQTLSTTPTTLTTPSSSSSSSSSKESFLGNIVSFDSRVELVCEFLWVIDCIQVSKCSQSLRRLVNGSAFACPDGRYTDMLWKTLLRRDYQYAGDSLWKFVTTVLEPEKTESLILYRRVYIETYTWYRQAMRHPNWVPLFRLPIHLAGKKHPDGTHTCTNIELGLDTLKQARQWFMLNYPPYTIQYTVTPHVAKIMFTRVRGAPPPELDEIKYLRKFERSDWRERGQHHDYSYTDIDGTKYATFPDFNLSNINLI